MVVDEVTHLGGLHCVAEGWFASRAPKASRTYCAGPKKHWECGGGVGLSLELTSLPPHIPPCSFTLGLRSTSDPNVYSVGLFTHLVNEYRGVGPRVREDPKKI